MLKEENSLVKTTADVPFPSDIRYGYLAFIDELKSLEEVYYKSSTDINLIQYIVKQYDFLLLRVVNYANHGKKLTLENKLDSLDNKDISILNYVHSAILSRINQLKSSNSSDLVIDILGFIKIIESNIDDLKEQQQIEKIDFYSKSYSLQIKQKIEEANKFIEQLSTTIELYNDEIDENFQKLTEEIEELQENAKKNEEELNKKKKELEEQLPLKMIFGGLKVLSSVLAFTGPQGSLAGSVIDSATNITEGFVLNDDKGNKLPLTSIPEGVVKGAQSFISGGKDFAKKTKEKKVKVTEERLKVITDILSEHPEGLSGKLKECQKRGKEITNQLNDLKKVEKDFSDIGDFGDINGINQTISDLEKDFSQILKEEKAALKEDKSNDRKHKKTMQWLDRTEKLVNIANAGVNIYNTFKAHESAINEIDQAIQANQETIKKLNEFEETINSYSQQTIANMKEDIKSLENSLSNKSHMALDVSKWEIQTQLKDIKYQLDQMTAGFNTQSAFIHIFEKISDAITTLIGIYDRIETYNEQTQLVGYIANVNSAGVVVDYPEINELKIIILQNIILERYCALISAVKQWAFPFAEKFFSDIDFMSNIDNNQKIEVNVSNILKIIKLLKDKVELYNVTITDIDKKIVKTSFGFSSSVVPPFFTWKRDKYSEIIKSLLKEGTKKYESEEVTFISSIQGSEYNSVKFNKIELNIKHINSTKQQELNDCLDNFNVYLTHSTDSYYEFNNKYYKFGGNIDVKSNNTLQLLYGFKKDKNGSPYTKNKAYEKLDQGELMLSPYSVWQIKLAQANSSDGKNYFTELEKYSEFVDLELVGTGSYVDEDNMTDEDKSVLSVDYYSITDIR